MYVPNFSELHAQDKSKLTSERPFSCDCHEVKHQTKTGSIQKQDDTNHTALDFNSCHLSYHIPVFGYIFRFIYVLSRFRIPSISAHHTMGKSKETTMQRQCHSHRCIEVRLWTVGTAAGYASLSILQRFFSLGSHVVPMIPGVLAEKEPWERFVGQDMSGWAVRLLFWFKLVFPGFNQLLLESAANSSSTSDSF